MEQKIQSNISCNIVISSTQYAGYGGAATNAYQLIKFLRKKGYNTVGIFFHTQLDVNYDPENIGGIFLYIDPPITTEKYDDDIYKKTINYLKGKPDLCLAKNYAAPIHCKKIFKCKTVYLVPGINHMISAYKGKTAIEVLDEKFKIEEFDISSCNAEQKCIDICDLIVLNSYLSFKLFIKIYPNCNKVFTNLIDTTRIIGDNIITCDNTINLTKEFDIMICCSNFKREIKNNSILIPILKNKCFENKTKIIVGSNYEDYLDIPNSKCVGLLEHKEVLKYMKKSKILLYPSLYESNSSTIFEAYTNNCLPIITKNIAFFEYFQDYLVCESFDNTEWTYKISYILENYDILIKQTKIIIPESYPLEYLITYMMNTSIIDN